MGWETRNGRRYYYRKQRSGRRVVSCYVGCEDDLATVLQAESDADAQAARQAGRDELRRLRAQDAPMVQAERAATAALQALTGAVLLTAGCYTHKGTWRRQHDTSIDGDAAARGARPGGDPGQDEQGQA